MKDTSTFTSMCIAVLIVSSASAEVLINFDDIAAGVIGDQYLDRGVVFFVGNGQDGNSTSILLDNGNPVSASVGNFGTSVSGPNVLTHGIGRDADIFVHFFNANGTRSFADLVGVTNDIDGGTVGGPPITINLFDENGSSIGVSGELGSGEAGELQIDGIWEARLSGVPGFGGTIGVDDFRFNVTAVPEPSTFAFFAISAFLGGCRRHRRHS